MTSRVLCTGANFQTLFNSNLGSQYSRSQSMVFGISRSKNSSAILPHCPAEISVVVLLQDENYVQWLQKLFIQQPSLTCIYYCARKRCTVFINIVVGIFLQSFSSTTFTKRTTKIYMTFHIQKLVASIGYLHDRSRFKSVR